MTERKAGTKVDLNKPFANLSHPSVWVVELRQACLVWLDGVDL